MQRARPLAQCRGPRCTSNRSSLAACLQFADEHRLLVEPACGASLAAVYGRADPLVGLDSVLVVVCGGAGVNLRLLAEWKQKYIKASNGP